MKTWNSDPKFMTGRPAVVGFLALLLAGAAESSAVEGWTWPRPAAVRELVTDPASFRPYAEQVSTEVERMLAVAPAPVREDRARLLSLRVHLALYLGHDARALATAAQIRATITPAAERPLSGLLTEAFVAARTEIPAGPNAREFAPALRAALDSRLASLPPAAELTVALARQRDRLRELTADALRAEAAQLAARLDGMPRWTLVDVDAVTRLGHRLATILPVRDVLVDAFEAALARRKGERPQSSTAARPRFQSARLRPRRLPAVHSPKPPP